MEIATSELREQSKKYKYLRRSMTLLQYDKPILSKVRLRKLHLKTIKDYEFTRNSKYYLKSKETSCVQSLMLEGEEEYRYLPLIKHLRSLKKFRLIIIGRQSMKGIFPGIKRLAKRIEVIDLFGYGLEQQASELQSLYRNLAAFPNLKVLKKAFNSDNGTCGSMENNYKLSNQFLVRLRKLKVFDLNCFEIFRSDIEETKLDRVYPVITGLSFSFGTILNEDEYEDIEELLEEETEDISFDKPQALISDNLIQKLSTEIARFFRFDHLPNLQKLRILMTEDYLFPLDASITQAFTSLKNLKQFELTMRNRPLGTSSILKGLLHLPLLTKFWLEIPFLKTIEYDLLAQFLQKQAQLVSMSLKIFGSRSSRTTYQAQNCFFENLWRCLENKTYLKYLALKSGYWNLESLSKGLTHTGTLNSLEEVWIEIFDDFVSGSFSAAERVEGLCDFLRQHKHSLRSIKLSLWYVVDDNIVDNIFKAISELNQLRSLNIDINQKSTLSALVDYRIFFIEKFSQDIVSIMKYRRLTFKVTCSVLNETLKELTKLCHLNLNLNYLMNDNILNMESVSNPNFSKMFSTLASIHELKSLYLNLPLLDQDLERHPDRIAFIGKLAVMAEVTINSNDENEIPEIQDILLQADQRRSLRCELQF